MDWGLNHVKYIEGSDSVSQTELEKLVLKPAGFLIQSSKPSTTQETAKSRPVEIIKSVLGRQS